MVKKQAILITGASTGIGKACAEVLAKNDFIVYAGARKDNDISQLSSIKNITGIKLDVTSDEDVQNAVKFIKEKGTRLFGLVNNAGIGVAGPLMDISVKQMQNQFEVNLFGLHRVTKAFFPFLLESKGRIVQMSSDSGFFATPFFGPYCSSKFALEGYSDSLRRELYNYDIKVIKIQPGRITTPIWNKGEKFLNKYENSIFAKEAQGIGEYAIEKGKTDGLDPEEVGELVHEILTVEKPKTAYLIAPSILKYKIIKLLSAKKIDKMIGKELKELKET